MFGSIKSYSKVRYELMPKKLNFRKAGGTLCDKACSPAFQLANKIFNFGSMPIVDYCLPFI